MTTDIPTETVRIRADGAQLEGDLAVPPDARAVVLFAHGSGSSRHSPRNRYVAAALNGAGFATLLTDLLTAGEDEIDQRTRELRFDIALLAARLTAAADWLASDARTAPLPLFLYGASTGAAAALRCAADRANHVGGVISRGGRPDLAADALLRQRAPILLIVGELDRDVRRLNERAAHTVRETGGSVEITVIPGATHLFEEAGALDAVIDATVARLREWLRSASPPGGAGR